MADVTYYLSLPYTKVLKRDEEGDVIATIAELDGCIAHGANESEALRNLNDAQTAWVEAALSDGQEIPLPEIEEELPSGKFVVRLSKRLHQQLNKIAIKDDVSLNVLMIMAVTEFVTRREVRAEVTHQSRHIFAWQESSGPWTITADPPLRQNYLTHLQKEKILEASREKKESHLFSGSGARK
jgi:predicted RNase H-like HicB family nuclease